MSKSRNSKYYREEEEFNADFKHRKNRQDRRTEKKLKAAMKSLNLDALTGEDE